MAIFMDGNVLSGQRYNNDGVRVGDEFVITSDLSSVSFSPPYVTGLDDGGFVVTFGSNRHPNFQLFGRIYDDDGISLGTEFQINSGTVDFNRFLEPTSLSDGGFVGVWQAWPNSTDDGTVKDVNVYGQRFDNLGVPVGTQFQVNTSASTNTRHPSVTELDNGNFLIAWHHDASTGNDRTIGQLFDSSGAKIGEEIVLFPYGEPVLTSLSGGGFAVGNGSLITLFDNEGEVVVADIDYTQPHSMDNIYGLSDGGLISVGAVSDGSSHYIVRYSSDGTQIGSALSFSSGSHRLYHNSVSSFSAILSNSNLITVYSDGTNILKGQIFEFPTDLTGGGESTTSITNTSDVVFMDVSSRNNALIAIGKSDTSLAIVNTERASLGAISNRLNHTESVPMCLSLPRSNLWTSQKV